MVRSSETQTDPVVPRRSGGLGLRGRALVLAGISYGLIAAIALGALWGVGGNIARDLGGAFAERLALWHKERASGDIGRDLALARQLADNPDLHAWARNEDDPALRERALAVLSAYRDRFESKAYFVAIAGSRHFYFSKDGERPIDAPPVETLRREDPDDTWYFHTVKDGGTFNINVDHNAELGVTKVWLNVPVRVDGEVPGVVGTGDDLSQFIEDLASPGQAGVTTMLLNRQGAIQAHPEEGLIAFNAPSREQAANTLYRQVDTASGQERLGAALDRLAAGDSAVEVLPLSINGAERLVAATWLDRLGWYSVSVLDLGAILGWPEFLLVAAVLAVALAAFLVLLSFLFEPLVLAPVRRLSLAAERVAQGDYSASGVPETRSDELGTLGRTFDYMTATLHDYTERLEERVAERTGQLQRAHDELERTNNALIDSLTCASRLQTAVLPALDILDPLAGHFVLWHPRDVVGGDLYLARWTDHGLYLGVIDCTGHGVPGALMTMGAYAAFGHALARTEAGPPAAVLTEMDHYMGEMLTQDDSAPMDHGLVMGLVRWRPDTDSLQFAGGGIDLLAVDPRTVDPEEPGAAVITVKGARGGLGQQRRQKGGTFADHTVTVPPGCAFYLTSDGFFDQIGGPRRRGFGRRRFYRLVAEQAGRPIVEQKQAFDDALADWQGEEDQRDDITVLAFRPLAERGGTGSGGNNSTGSPAP